jgi:hypothetical protein
MIICQVCNCLPCRCGVTTSGHINIPVFDNSTLWLKIGALEFRIQELERKLAEGEASR